ncbi:MAG: helix-turn-helix domain-containing protein [Acidobacteriota bacterium]
MMASENRKQISEKPADGADQAKRQDFLTARQLAEVLQISEATIHRLRRAGRIPAISITGRLIRFNLKDVKNALRSESRADYPARDLEPSPQLSFDDLFSDFTPARGE